MTTAPPVYDGETLYSWNPGQGRVEYTYWNSLGGVRPGSMAVVGDRLTFTSDKGQPAAVWRKAGPNAYRAVSAIGGEERGVTFIRID